MDTMRFTKCVGKVDGEKKWGKEGYAAYLAACTYRKPGSTTVYAGFAFDLLLIGHTEGQGSTGEPKAFPVEGLTEEALLADITAAIAVKGVDVINRSLTSGLKLYEGNEVVPDSTQRKINDADRLFWAMGPDVTDADRKGLDRDGMVALYNSRH